MKLSARTQGIKDYAEKLGLEVDVTEVSERSGWLTIKDPSVSRGWLQIIQTGTGYERKTYSHSAIVAYSAAADPKRVTMHLARTIMRGFAEDL